MNGPWSRLTFLLFISSFNMSEKPMFISQKIAAGIAMVSSVVAVLCIINWMQGTNPDQGYLGGLK